MPARHHILDLQEIIDDYSPGDPPVDRVRIAKSLILAAIGILDQVAKETRDSNARAYMIDQLACLASADHGFLSSGFTLDAWIYRLEDSDDEEVQP